MPVDGNVWGTGGSGRGWIVALGVVFVIAACDSVLTEAPLDEDLLDAPLAGLSPAEEAAFLRGDEEFGRPFAPSDGLGPIFNGIACAACHSGDGRGRPDNILVRFGEAPDFARELGGPQLQDRALPEAVPERMPAGIPVSRRLPPPVFGVGLIEAVADEEILSRHDPDDVDGDGISGRVHWVTPPEWVGPDEPGGPGPDGRAIGRFSRKAQVSSLLQQTVEAYHQDIGVTSDFLPVENVNPLARDESGSADRVADPEIPESTVRAVVAYIRRLAFPSPGPETSAVARGRALFDEVGCADCHVPVLRTGPSDVQVLAFRDVPLFSDLLLHDMGAELSDGRRDHDAAPAEWRTTPLWGMRVARDFLDGDLFLLHDGRAHTIPEAIGFHGGEAAASRAAFQALDAANREALVRFVETR